VDAIDERTLLVPISHVCSRTARSRTSSDRSRARGRRLRGARLLPVRGRRAVRLTELGVEFAVGGSVKWLCGGPGAGWLYVRPDLAERLEPTLVGWQGHARPFAFEPSSSTPPGAPLPYRDPNVPALYAATAGYDVIEEVGVRGSASARSRSHSS